jgi:sugar phosphate isomerase/epimerase
MENQTAGPMLAVQQIQLGSRLNTEEQARETLAAVRWAGFDGIELNEFMTQPTGLVVQLLTRAAGMPTGRGGKLNWPKLIGASGLTVPALHMDLGTIGRDATAAALRAKKFGADTIVITAMYRFPYQEEAQVRELAGRLNRAGKALKARGVRLLYHNHNIEFLRYPDGKMPYDILMEETDPEFVNFEFDSYWAADAGADTLAVMRRLGGRLRLWHINDRGAVIKKTPMTPIVKMDSTELGRGCLNLTDMWAAAVKAGVDAVILESHRNWIDGDPVKSAAVSCAWMKRQKAGQMAAQLQEGAD